jgi:uncharacterized protein YgiM (DUF1202 family)
MVRRSSRTLVAVFLPLLLGGCINITAPLAEPVTVPPPPGPENTNWTGPQGEGPEAESFPQSIAVTTPAVTYTSAESTIKATPERPIPGQLKARYASSTINVREGPGTNYAVLFQAHPNDMVMITHEVSGTDGHRWYQINHYGWGWVREDLVQEGLLSLQPDLATITAKQARSNINIREGPSQAYRIIHTARVGDRFPLVDQAWDNDGYAWYRLDLNYSGWVREDLITKGTAAP